MAISLILASSAACGLASSRRLAWIFVLAALALLAAFLAFPARNDPALAGDEAYRRGDYARALAEYQQAARQGADPQRLTNNQAAALYKLQHYSEADTLYRRSGDGAGELQGARAAYDRGNCAFRQACGHAGLPERHRLEHAAEQYQDCLGHEKTTPNAGTLYADARHNLQLTNRLLEQTTPAQPSAPPPEERAPQTVRKDTEDRCPTCGQPIPRSDSSARKQQEHQASDKNIEARCPT